MVNKQRAFSYIDDSLEPLWNAAILPEASKQIINLGGIEEYTVLMKPVKYYKK
jgi:UDP-glucose 4-epimerase